MIVPKPEASILYQTFAEADRLRTLAIADGMSKEDANQMVAKALQQAWPKGREQPWVYLCDVCSDSGYQPLQCPAQPCDRVKVHSPHDYVRLCSCGKGRGLQAPPRLETDELAAVGKMPKKPTRFGR